MKKIQTLTFQQRKALRAIVIRKHVQQARYEGVVCFSCGNASLALQDEGLYVVDICPSGSLIAGKWWYATDIHRAFPHLFDATSGHLPVELLNKIAKTYRGFLGDLQSIEYNVPTGSGETIVALCIAYPHIAFNAVYNVGKGTTFEPNAPLNSLVELLAKTVKK